MFNDIGREGKLLWTNDGSERRVMLGYWELAVQSWPIELLPEGLETRISVAPVKDFKKKYEANLRKKNV